MRTVCTTAFSTGIVRSTDLHIREEAIAEILEQRLPVLDGDIAAAL